MRIGHLAMRLAVRAQMNKRLFLASPPAPAGPVHVPTGMHPPRPSSSLCPACARLALCPQSTRMRS